MLAMPGMRGFAVSAAQSAHDVSCNAQGVSIGHVPLLEKGDGRWMPRRAAELNVELTTCYRLPIDIAAKANALSLIAHALNRGDLAMAAIAAVQMQIPDPPRLAKEHEKPEEIVRRARELARSGLLKVWEPEEHPRTGTPPSPGWFAPVDGSKEQDIRVAANPGPNNPWTGFPDAEGGGGGGPASRSAGEKSDIPSSASEASGATPKPSPPADTHPILPFPEGLPKQRAPAADADSSAEDSPAEGPARGGRLGNPPVRTQNAEIAADLKKQGYKITGGGGEAKEEYIPGEGPGTKGSTYVDITAVNKTTGKVVRVQTVDTLADGTPDGREEAAIVRIRKKFPNDELRIIPKR